MNLNQFLINSKRISSALTKYSKYGTIDTEPHLARYALTDSENVILLGQ